MEVWFIMDEGGLPFNFRNHQCFHDWRVEPTRKGTNLSGHWFIVFQPMIAICREVHRSSHGLLEYLESTVQSRYDNKASSSEDRPESNCGIFINYSFLLGQISL